MGRGSSQFQASGHKLLFGRRSAAGKSQAAAGAPGEQVWSQLVKLSRDLENDHFESSLSFLRQNRLALENPGQAPAVELVFEQLVEKLLVPLDQDPDYRVRQYFRTPISAAAEKEILRETLPSLLRQRLHQTPFPTATEISQSLTELAFNAETPGPFAHKVLLDRVFALNSQANLYLQPQVAIKYLHKLAQAKPRPTIFNSALSLLETNLPVWWPEKEESRKSYLKNLLELSGNYHHHPNLISANSASFPTKLAPIHLRQLETRKTLCGRKIDPSWEGVALRAWQKEQHRCQGCHNERGEAFSDRALAQAQPHLGKEQIEAAYQRVEKACQAALSEKLSQTDEPSFDNINDTYRESLEAELVQIISTELGSGRSRKQRLWELLPPQGRKAIKRPSRLGQGSIADIALALEAMNDWPEDFFASQSFEKMPPARVRAFRETLGQRLWKEVQRRKKK